jgi:alkyldihydroxyacetonephosphate synthase
MRQPATPIELNGTADHFAGSPVEIPPQFLEELGKITEIDTDLRATAEASRDWWPIALHWALAGSVPRRAAVLARPRSTEEVATICSLAQTHQVPITPAGGRSGVCGASVPVFGGLVMDMTGLQGVGEVDVTSGIVEVAAGTFGPDLESHINARYGLSVGHFPQSFDISTVGGWVAARGAGQFSTRYGKIEDMVVGLEAVLASGTVVRTGGAPAAAVGPDLTQLLIGSEGTLGIITRVWLRTHPCAPHQSTAAFRFASFAEGIEACRNVLRSGATPAVLRLYDAVESARGRGGNGTDCVLLVLDEGEPELVEATMTLVDRACANAAVAEPGLVDAWLAHRNDTSALQSLTHKGFVVDTMEIAAPWSRLEEIYDATCTALMAVPTARSASAHLSHSYADGACLYFSFAASPPADQLEATYVALWDAGQRAVLAHGGNLSHHHGVGVNRQRFISEALGEGHVLLQAIKDALDPNGILNPGKMGLRSSFGESFGEPFGPAFGEAVGT